MGLQAQANPLEMEVGAAYDPFELAEECKSRNGCQTNALKFIEHLQHPGGRVVTEGRHCEAPVPCGFHQAGMGLTDAAGHKHQIGADHLRNPIAQGAYVLDIGQRIERLMLAPHQGQDIGQHRPGMSGQGLLAPLEAPASIDIEQAYGMVKLPRTGGAEAEIERDEGAVIPVGEVHGAVEVIERLPVATLQVGVQPLEFRCALKDVGVAELCHLGQAGLQDRQGLLQTLAEEVESPLVQAEQGQGTSIAERAGQGADLFKMCPYIIQPHDGAETQLRHVG